MKTFKIIALMFTCWTSAICWTNEDSWHSIISTNGISNAAINFYGYGGYFDAIYYSVNDEGLYKKTFNQQGNPIQTYLIKINIDGIPEGSLNNVTNIHISEHTRRTYITTYDHMFSIDSDIIPPKLNLVQTKGLTEIKKITSSINGTYVLSKSSQLFNVVNDSLQIQRFPEELVTRFSTVTPVKMGQSCLTSPLQKNKFPWVIFECQDYSKTQYYLYSLPYSNIKPISLPNSLNYKDNFIFGVSYEGYFLSAASEKNQIILYCWDTEETVLKIKKIILDNNTLIKDLMFNNNKTPQNAEKKRFFRPGELLCMASSTGSYAINIKNLMKSDDSLVILREKDTTIYLYDSIPSQKAIYTFNNNYKQQCQYFINDSGIIAHFTPYALSKIKMHLNTNKKRLKIKQLPNFISVTMNENQSGTLSLLNLKGQKLSAVNFVHSNKVLLSTAGNLAKGVYLLKLQTKSGVVTEKLRVE